MIFTEFGCTTRLAALASRSKRRTNVRSRVSSSFMILRATSRGSSSCSATQTVAIPPSPSRREILYRPATVRPMSGCGSVIEGVGARIRDAWPDRVETVKSSLMRVRSASFSDARAIALVHVEAWRATYRGMMPDATVDAFAGPDDDARLRGRAPSTPARPAGVTIW